MNLRMEYGSEEMDRLFCYFMRTVLRIQKNGAFKIPIDISLEEPWNEYLKKAINLMENAQPLEITNLILQVELEQILKQYQLTKHQIFLLILIKELSIHIRSDEDCFTYLLSTGNLWNNKANEYATKTFYCNLPPEVQKKQGLSKIVSNIPITILEPENF